MLSEDKTLRNFVITKSLLNDLQKEKVRSGLSMSAIVNIAVREYLEKIESKNKKALK